MDIKLRCLSIHTPSSVIDSHLLSLDFQNIIRSSDYWAGFVKKKIK